MTKKPQKELVTAPLLRRESMGEHYHVLTFDLPTGITAGAGQFMMIRGAEWGDAPLLPRPMSYLTAGNTPSILIKVIGEGTLRMGRAEPGEPFTLLGTVVDAAREAGGRLVLLEARTSNEAALALYRSAGFFVTDVRRAYYSDNGEDAVVMRLELSSPNPEPGS